MTNDILDAEYLITMHEWRANVDEECDVGDKNSVWDNSSTQVVATVGVEKYIYENIVKLELKIFNLYV